MNVCIVYWKRGRMYIYVCVFVYDVREKDEYIYIMCLYVCVRDRDGECTCLSVCK